MNQELILLNYQYLKFINQHDLSGRSIKFYLILRSGNLLMLQWLRRFISVRGLSENIRADIIETYSIKVEGM